MQIYYIVWRAYFQNNHNWLMLNTDISMYICKVMVIAIMFNASFNSISAISWRSVIFVWETGVPGENHRLPQVTDKFNT